MDLPAVYAQAFEEHNGHISLSAVQKQLQLVPGIKQVCVSKHVLLGFPYSGPAGFIWLKRQLAAVRKARIEHAMQMAMQAYHGAGMHLSLTLMMNSMLLASSACLHNDEVARVAWALCSFCVYPCLAMIAHLPP